MSSVFLRAPLDAVENSPLKRAIRHWNDAIIEGGDIKNIRALMNDQNFLKAGSITLLVADRDQPEDFASWFIAGPMGELPAALRDQLVGQRFGKIPDAQFIKASITSFRDAFSPADNAGPGQPAYHRFCGVVAGIPLNFQRILFPVYDDGRPDRMLSLSCPLKVRPAKTRRRAGDLADRRLDAAIGDLAVAAAS